MFKKNNNLLKNLEMKLEAPLLEVTSFLSQKIKNNAPKKTGKLKNSIKYKKIGELKTSIYSDVYYAPFVEFGTFKQAPNPFFRSAIKENQSRIIKKFKGKI